MPRSMTSWGRNASDGRAALLLATEPLDRTTGRVTYSQAILREFGWITEARGRGVDTRGSGYSEI